jgi:hypothetical protein
MLTAITLGLFYPSNRISAYDPSMPPNRYRGPPMTLANMRENGVRSLWVVCPLCHHEAVVNVDSFEPDVAVPAFGPRMVCTGCGIIGADVRPNWQERPPRESITGMQWS